MRTIKENYVGACVSCGAPVPEGRMICPICEKQLSSSETFEKQQKKNGKTKHITKKGGK